MSDLIRKITEDTMLKLRQQRRKQIVDMLTEIGETVTDETLNDYIRDNCELTRNGDWYSLAILDNGICVNWSERVNIESGLDGNVKITTGE